MKRKLTAIVPTFNEEENIRECLESIAWTDEILVVDSLSTDNTREIASEFTDRILKHEYKYSTAQKNWTIPQASHEWILLVDADERCTPELKQEIQELLNAEEDPPHDAFWIYRRNFFLGKEVKHCGWNRDRVIRLFRRDDYRYEDVEVHGEIQPQDDLGTLTHKLLHYSYRTLEDYFIKMKRYTIWGAQKADKKNMNGNLLTIIGRPVWKFFSYYFLKLGFLDGKTGLILCVLSSISVFMRYVKLWEIQSQKK